MAVKLTLVVAIVCMAQVVKCAKEIDFEELPDDFIELYENFDDWIGKPLTLYSILPYIKEQNKKTINCYMNYKDEYSTAISTFTLAMGENVKGIKQYLEAYVGANKGQYAHYGHKIHSYWKKIIGKISKYPKELGYYLKTKEFDKAEKRMDETKKQIEFTDVMDTYNMNNLREHSPHLAEKVEERIHPLREKIILTTTDIAKKIIKCIN